MPSSAPKRSPLAALIAADEHWIRAGSTGRGLPELQDRRATRTVASTPYNLEVHCLVEDYEADLAAYVARYGAPLTARPAAMRADIYAAADAIAESSPLAGAERDAIDLAQNLTAACTIGAGAEAVATVTCPACLCWGLLPVRDPRDGWRAACRNLACGTPQGPRTWTLREIAEHHLREQDIAA